MMPAEIQTGYCPDSSLEESRIIESKILEIGNRIFSGMSKRRPTPFCKNYWTDLLLGLSMRDRDLKQGLFRLIDSLPSLQTSSQIAEHINLYLGSAAHSVHPILASLIKSRPNSFKAKLAGEVFRYSVALMASQFIAGDSAIKSLPSLTNIRQNRMAFTVDLLGEFSLSEQDALSYLGRYISTIKILAEHFRDAESVFPGHLGEDKNVSISVKLSALYSQTSSLNFEKSVSILSERLSTIISIADRLNVSVFIDAEDTKYNPIIYATFKNVFGSGRFKGYPYPGIVVQAYSKASRLLVEDLIQFAKTRGAPIGIRLVKGAYWDAETASAKLACKASPLFAKKETSDANYEELSRLLLDNTEHVYPAFGSHNVRSLAQVCAYADYREIPTTHFEVQMLYGMANEIASAFAHHQRLVRLYVPVGDMILGMGYFVRRLLENTSNESFLRNTFYDPKSIDILLKKPLFGE